MWSKMEGKRKENSHPSHRINQQLFCHLPNTGASPPCLGEVSVQISDWQSADSGRAAADTSRRIRDLSENTVLRMRLGNLGTSQRAHYHLLKRSVGSRPLISLGHLPLTPSLSDSGITNPSALCFPLSFLFLSLLLFFSLSLPFVPSFNNFQSTPGRQSHSHLLK